MPEQTVAKSDTAECGVWSGSALFAIHQLISDKSACTEMDLFKLQDKYGKEFMFWDVGILRVNKVIRFVYLVLW